MSLYDDLISNRERLTDSLEKDHLNKLEKALRDLETKIITAVNVNLDTRIALQLRPNIERLIREEYSTWVNNSVNDYDQIAGQILENYGELPIDKKFATLTQGSAQTIAELKRMGFGQLNTLGLETSQILADEIYMSALAGKSFEDVVSSIREKITGSEGIGRSLRTRARQIAHDGIMQFDAQMNAMIALDAGLTNFIYMGNTIKDTRDFCRRNLNRTFSKQEIDQVWASQNWQGKSTSNGLIARGGYNCRHHWQATDPSWDI
tara:strand:- start:84 stop:872 length:789 start_codon:yes stop_codon:yes gene_type:complete